MRAALALVVALALPCLAQTETSEGHSPALPVLEEVGGNETLAAYRVPEERFEITLGPAKEGSRYVERAASFPSPKKARWGTIHGT